MLSENVKRSLMRVAGDMAMSVTESGNLPVTVDLLTRNFELAYTKLQSIVEDQEHHEVKGRHIEK